MKTSKLFVLTFSCLIHFCLLSNWYHSRPVKSVNIVEFIFINLNMVYPFLFYIKNMLSEQCKTDANIPHKIYFDLFFVMFTTQFFPPNKKQTWQKKWDKDGHSDYTFCNPRNSIWDCNIKKVNHLKWRPVENACHFMFYVLRRRRAKKRFCKIEACQKPSILCQSLWTISNPLSS